MGGEQGDRDEFDAKRSVVDGEAVSAFQEVCFFSENLRLAMDEVDPSSLEPDEAAEVIYLLNRLWEHAFYRKCMSRAAEGLIEQKRHEASQEQH